MSRIMQAAGLHIKKRRNFSFSCHYLRIYYIYYDAFANCSEPSGSSLMYLELSTTGLAPAV